MWSAFSVHRSSTRSVHRSSTRSVHRSSARSVHRSSAPATIGDDNDAAVSSRHPPPPAARHAHTRAHTTRTALRRQRHFSLSSSRRRGVVDGCHRTATARGRARRRGDERRRRAPLVRGGRTTASSLRPTPLLRSRASSNAPRGDAGGEDPDSRLTPFERETTPSPPSLEHTVFQCPSPSPLLATPSQSVRRRRRSKPVRHTHNNTIHDLPPLSLAARLRLRHSRATDGTTSNEPRRRSAAASRGTRARRRRACPRRRRAARRAAARAPSRGTRS